MSPTTSIGTAQVLPTKRSGSLGPWPICLYEKFHSRFQLRLHYDKAGLMAHQKLETHESESRQAVGYGTIRYGRVPVTIP